MSNFRVPVSAEFFPPKTEEGARQILRTANAIKNFPLDMVSITYGAGGSSRERTIEYGELIQEIFNFNVMPHLTCVGHSKAELNDILARFAEKGFSRIMALRGDPPKDVATFVQHPDGLAYASDLISMIRQTHPNLKIACAAYPEKHPEAPSADFDIEMLKLKVKSGAQMAITQLFFDNKVYFDFVKKCRVAGINIPIRAGIMPVLSLKQLRNFSTMCGCSIPQELEQKLTTANSEQEELKVGIEWAKAQISELVENNVDGIHLYILNRVNSALELLNFLASFSK
jgi:5,10-methylenetetrahydrofolate reductase, prokaryotic form